MGAEQPAQAAFELARAHWSQFLGTRRILLERLTFVREEVREDSPTCWVDLAPVVLGRTLVPGSASR
jgi:hypothetical protein